MAEHTPGPWTVEEEQTWPYGISIRSGDGDVVSMRRAAYSTEARTLDQCHMAVGFDEVDRPLVVASLARQMADARLIAAAPDLLAALESAEIALSNVIHDRPSAHTDDIWASINASHAVARAAIARAKGETL